MATSNAPNAFVKLALEFAPLVLFFLANGRFGIFAATGAFMVAILISLAISYWLLRKLPVMAVVSAVVVLVFGGLTIALHDETFIKVKPTIVNCLFGTVLLGGLAMGRPLLPLVLDQVLTLTPAGWRKLTFRWAIFFFVLAVTNEVVRLNFSTEAWVNFKSFGTIPLTLIFALAQTPLILRHGEETQGGKA
ncbi:intracellular septation protein [Rhizobiales bacterium GAS191]|jgi:intracellular septation protein|nr:intracellular septation protein [Rhizobiales bacterium GAS113]SEC10661.1 intracellular septation protein [Rhizobiales bacterium GAS191]SED09548.1 intracellular septation protein [Rhizobiales bacterium GAS188]